MWNKPVVVIAALLIGALGLGIGLYSLMNKPRYAYVVLTEVFDKFQMKKELSQKFEQQTFGMQKGLDSIAFTLQQEATRLEAMENPPQAEVDKYLMARENYTARREQFENDRQFQTAAYDKQIIERMSQYVKDYGAQNGYTFIYGDDGNGNIMYADGTTNVTTDVVTYLNNRYAGQTK